MDSTDRIVERRLCDSIAIPWTGYIRSQANAAQVRAESDELGVTALVLSEEALGRLEERKHADGVDIHMATDVLKWSIQNGFRGLACGRIGDDGVDV
jgi:hypothetical protein